MPSLMVHLLTAYQYNPNASTIFWIGNIAPDVVSDWKEKDKTHFRDQPDRLTVLREYAHSIDLSDDFSQGTLLHLFLDYYWDCSPMRNFVERCKEENWLRLYRHETALTGNWIFHHAEGINSLIQSAKRRARGFRTYEGYECMIYLVVGKLNLSCPTLFA